MSDREALLAECDIVCTSGCHSDDCEHHGHIPAALGGDLISRTDLDQAMAVKFERLPTALNMVRGVLAAAPSAPSADLGAWVLERSGDLSYDEDERTLVWTDRIGPNEYGAAAIVAVNVLPWFGRVVQAMVRGAISPVDAKGDRTPDPCDTCGGSGYVTGIDADPLPSGEPGEPYQTQEQCPDCGGSGGIVVSGAPVALEEAPLHETHVCRDCGAEITIPYVRPGMTFDEWEGGPCGAIEPGPIKVGVPHTCAARPGHEGEHVW